MFVLSQNIRTNTDDKLVRKVSLVKMHNSLISLFVDNTSADTKIRNLLDEDCMKMLLRYSDCLSLNDEKTIAFHQRCRQDDYVFDEDRQIWIDGTVDTEKNDLFIPRDDAQ